MTTTEIPAYMRTYAERWKEIVEHPDGSVNLDQVARELADYDWLQGAASEVYASVSGDRISKPETMPFEVINANQEREMEAVDAAIDGLIRQIEADERGPLRTAEIVTLIRELTGRPAA